MRKFKTSMLLGEDTQKIEDAANEVVELLAKKNLSIENTELVLQNAQEFIKRCMFVIPEEASQQ